MKITRNVPATDSWREIVLKLDPARIKPGSLVHDITLFQMGRDNDSRLYIKSVSLWTDK